MAIYSARARERAMKVQDVILRALSKQITFWQAAHIARLSPRQLRRWFQRYRRLGMDGLYDQRTGRPSAKRVPWRSFFTYLWDSSTGTQSDLSGCTVGESVYYPNYSTTPYIWSLPMVQSTTNPTVVPGPATSAGFTDTNSPPDHYQTPYSSTSFSATQRFWWSCTNYNNGATQVLYPDATITRTILFSTVWKYQITKQGYTNTFNLP